MNIIPCEKIPKSKWKWEEGDKIFKDSSISTSPLYRNYFDCGVYYFDGEFNVVKFPKGMTIYHGSGILADNLVEYPAGIEFYNKEGANINSSRLNNKEFMETTDKSIEEIVSEKVNITPGWYGDLEAAEIYSANPGNNKLADVCKDKCVFTYKLKKDIVLYLLDDDFNIGKLLNSHGSVMPEKQKKNLITMFDLKSIKPQFTNEYNKLTFKKNRTSYYTIDKEFAIWACKTLIQPYEYAGYAANKQLSEFHHGSFHLEFIFCNPFTWIERDLDNKYDWQKSKIEKASDYIQLYFQQLSLYETTNINWHAGNLLEHSVWSLLWAETIMNGEAGEDGMRWDYGYDALTTDDTDVFKITAFAAFIHDIGKIEPFNNRDHTIYNATRKKYIYFNVPTHGNIGYEYFQKTKQFPILNQENNTVKEYLDIDKLMRQFGISFSYRKMISVIIKQHWEFGNLLKKFNDNRPRTTDIELGIYSLLEEDIYKYLKETYELLSPSNAKEFLKCVYSLIVVSIADINATQPFGINRLSAEKPDVRNLNITSKTFKFITNMPKNYKGGNVAQESNISTVGRDLGLYIIEKSRDFKP